MGTLHTSDVSQRALFEWRFASALTGDLFEYDAARSLDVEVLGGEKREHASLRELRFAAARDGTVSAFLIEPYARTPAAVVYAHGGYEPGKHVVVEQGFALAAGGLTVLLADTTLPQGDIETETRAYADAVLVQRRSLDVLAAHGYSRFGFFGHSMGGAQGSVLTAVEPRLDAIVIAAMGTGFAEYARRSGLPDEHYLRRIHDFDPIHFVSTPHRALLLFQLALGDELVPPFVARALFDGAAEPKELREYEGDHSIDAHPQALADRIAFFREMLL
jgi:cephalosporin-C deacetylase-like acetyl esterase